MNKPEGPWSVIIGFVKNCLTEVTTETAIRNKIALNVLWERKMTVPDATEVVQDQETKDSIEDEPADKEEEDGEEEDEDKERSIEDERKNSDVNSEANLWKKLIEEVMNYLNSHWEEQVIIHTYQGASKEHAEAETFNALLPAFQKGLRYVNLKPLKMVSQS